MITESLKSLLPVSLLLSGLLGMTSCHSYGGPDYEGSRLIVTAEIAQAGSKAQASAWLAGDRIGVYSDLREDNVMFSTPGDGTFTSSVPVYVLGGGTVSYTGYYPHSYSVSSISPVIRFSTPIDFMWATGTATRQSPEVHLVFHHIMSSISVTIKDNAPTSTTDRGTIKLEGIRKEGEFDTLKGSVTADGLVSTVSSEFTLDERVTFILPPQRPDHSITVIVELDGKSYSGEFNIDRLAEATDYRYTIDLTNASSTGNFSISSATITGWTSVNGGEVLMDHDK